MATKPDSNGHITKAAAVREALSALGNDAKPPEIHAHVKKQHNLDMDLNAISSYKSQALKSGKSAIIKKPEPKKAGAKVAKKKVNKTEVVREAINKLGKDAKPLEIQAHIKSANKLNLSTALISNYKNTILKGPASKSAMMEKPGRPAGKKKLGRPAGKKMGRPAGSTKASSNGISIQDIEAVKSLTDRLGARQVKEIADVLA